MTDLPKPLVTVVIPTYNYGDKVSVAIKSVMEQTLNNLECFIIDDGSTDNTQQLVEEFIANDSRFHYIKQGNAGVAEARNRGVFMGSGAYVVCLDADDSIAPQFLEACATFLNDHPDISIAYTGLWVMMKDGTEGLSPWPGEFNYDEQLRGNNQIPTCNMARREVWERLGGQRQRYAPDGAGEEDAELWLRAGAYGFQAKRVTEAGLFYYRWMTGRVSGDRHHRPSNWLGWHPWVKDNRHPFMSVATPADGRPSHPVRQYDNPYISVIIPVKKGHEKIVEFALDSLEAQTFRNWEAILAWDSEEDYSNLLRVYPYAKVIPLHPGDKAYGAGYARNRGVEAARAPLLLYLDADDYLIPECLEMFMRAYNIGGDAIYYTDYIGKAFIEPSLARQLDRNGRLLDINQKTGLASIAYYALDYNCESAIRQPDQDLYIWNLVTSLVPRQFHFDIGGFDESMISWEDWDYYIRMAKAGKCFEHITDMLVVYRFYGGERREKGLANHKNLLQYLVKKYEGVKVMPCSSCPGGGRRTTQVQPAFPNRQYGAQMASRSEETQSMSDDKYKLIRYNHPNVGQHRVIGQGSNPPNPQRDYGQRGGGEEFLVHVDDIARQPDVFIPVELPSEKPPAAVVIPAAPAIQPTIPAMVGNKAWADMASKIAPPAPVVVEAQKTVEEVKPIKPAHKTRGRAAPKASG